MWVLLGEILLVLVVLFVVVKRLCLWKGRNVFTKKYRKKFEMSEKEEEELVKKTERDFPGFEKEKYDAIIIGSGLSGLSCGAMLAKGYKKKVLVLEQHPDVIGGCTHCFTEEGFEFDSGVHFLGNIAEDSDGLFQTLSDFVSDGECLYEYTKGSADITYTSYDSKNSRRFAVPTKFDDMKANLIKEFPKEKEGIVKYFKMVQEATDGFDFFTIYKSLPPLLQKFVKNAPFGLFSKTKKYINLTVTDVFDECFKDPVIKSLLYDNTMFGSEEGETSFLFFVATMSVLEVRSYITGGSEMFARKIGKVIAKYGGKSMCNAPVSRILTTKNGGKAIGVKLKSGKKVYSDMVISTAGIKKTYERLLPSKSQEFVEKNSNVMKLVKDMKATDCYAMVYLGFKGNAKDIGLPKLEQYWMNMHVDNAEKHKNFYNLKTFNPKTYSKAWGNIAFASSCYIKKDGEKRFPNQCILNAFLRVRPEWFEQWKDTKVKNRGNEYKELKSKMLDYVLDVLFKNHPHLKDKLEYADISSSLTMKHYIGNDKGGCYGTRATPARFNNPNLEVSPVSNLYLSGQDTFLAGVTSQWISAAYTVSKITGNNLLLQATIARLFEKNPKTTGLEKETKKSN